MKKSFLAVLSAFLLLSGCKVFKKKDFTDTTTKTEEIDRSLTTRPADTVTVERKYNIKYKDTTIYTTSYNTKTIIRETYDSEGNQRIDCIPEEIREELETIRRKIDNNIESSSETEHKLDLTPLIWAIAGLGFIIILALVIIAYIMTSFKKTISDVVTRRI